MIELHHAIEVLTRTPTTLAALLGGLSDFWTRNNYGPETFSPFDVVGHLIHAERANQSRLDLILAGDGRFPPFDRYAMYQSSQGKSLQTLLETFADARQVTLDRLNALPTAPETFTMTGTHADLGEVTLENLIATWVVHDLGHLHQIAKSMAFQFRDHVGPWSKVLTILPSS